jgi:fatty-acyl-CoA synthase
LFITREGIWRVDVAMGLVANIRRDIRFVKGLRSLLGRIKPITMDSVDLVCDDWEEAVDKFPDHIAVQDDRRSLSYRELDAMANRFGHWAISRRLKRGDTVALVMLTGPSTSLPGSASPRSGSARR